jgi:hypothetical protein
VTTDTINVMNAFIFIDFLLDNGNKAFV